MKLNSHLIIPLKKSVGKILHITDTHLFADDENTLLGVKTNASFAAVIDNIKKRAEHFDLIVATGDFVQDGSQAAYLRFAQTIKQFMAPCVWLAGNHDIHENMQYIFKQQGLPENKIVLLGEKWLIIMLNSQVVGETYGELSKQQLAFLTASLQKYPDRFAMVFLHHHPLMSNCDWLDKHSLINHVEFINLINQLPQIKGVGWGHIHQITQQRLPHCLAFSTPSTCVQFKPLSRDFSVANDAPGWRVIELKPEGHVDTAVYNLENNLFEPDLSQNGY